MRKKKKNNNKLGLFLVSVDIFAVICFFVVYGPFSFFRDWYVTTAMTTMTHRYLAYIFYNQDMIDEVLNNNRIIESTDPTDTSKISFNPDFNSDSYESVYEEQILKKDEGNDDYKILEIEGDKWHGYMAVIYDPSRIELVFTKNYGKSRGNFISKLGKENNALVAMTGSGVKHKNGVNYVTGTTIKDGKVFAVGKDINKGGGLIGFTKDNVLMLTKKSAKEAIADGMDRAVEFGPFLIVNGKSATFSGNGGGGKHPRTAIAQRQDGIVLFVVIEGRTSKSSGMTFPQLTELLEKYKAYNAANLDGGGSSSLYAIVNGKGKLLNEPGGYGYEGERYMPNAWMLLPEVAATDDSSN